MNILPFDKASAGQSAETVLSGLAQIPSGTEAPANSFESVLVGASPGIVIQTSDGNSQNSGQSAAQSDASTSNASVATTSLATGTAIGNDGSENSSGDFEQEPAEEKSWGGNAHDRPVTDERDLGQFAGGPVVQSILTLAMSPPPIVPVKAKQDGSSNGSLSGIAAIGEVRERTTAAAKQVQQFTNSYFPSPPASDPDTGLKPDTKGIKLSGQWDVVALQMDDRDLGELSTGDPSGLEGGVGQKQESELSGKAVTGWAPKASNRSNGDLAEAFSPEGFSNYPGDRQVNLGGNSVAQAPEGNANQNHFEPENPGSEIQLLAANTALAESSNSEDTEIRFVGRSFGLARSEMPAGSLQAELPASGAAAPTVKTAAISSEVRLITSQAKPATDQKGTDSRKGVEPFVRTSIQQKDSSGETPIGTADFEKAPQDIVLESPANGGIASAKTIESKDSIQQTDSRGYVNSDLARPQDQDVRIKKPRLTNERSAALESVRVQRKGLQRDGAILSNPVKLQNPQATRPDLQVAQPPSQSVLGSPGASAGANSERRPFAGAQEGFARLVSPLGEARRAAIPYSKEQPEKAAQLATKPGVPLSGVATDPKTGSVNPVSLTPASTLIAGINSEEADGTVVDAASASAFDQAEIARTTGQTVTVRTTGDTSGPIERAAGGTNRDSAEAKPERNNRNEVPPGPSASSQRDPGVQPASRLVASRDANAVRVDLTQTGAVANHEMIRFPRLSRTPDRGGIVDAQQDAHMVSSRDNEPGVELAGKNMPNSGRNDSPSRNVVQLSATNEPSRARVDSSGDRMADLAISSNAWLDNAERARSLDEPIGSLRAEGHLHTRLTERIWSAVETFRSAGSNDWVVRIRPDQGTELGLRLKLQENQVVIHARLESGNWDAVAPGWRDLQAQLANRGIQLQPLEGSGDRSSLSQNFNPTNSDTQSQRRHSGEDGRNFQDIREFDVRFTPEVPERKKPQLTAKSATSGNGWESWA